MGFQRRICPRSRLLVPAVTWAITWRTTHPEAGKPGWYFLIEEHATEPRFGLEPETSTAQDGSWNELSWNDADVVLDHGFLNPAAALSSPSREGVTWGQNSAAMAYILMRRP